LCGRYLDDTLHLAHQPSAGRWQLRPLLAALRGLLVAKALHLAALVDDGGDDNASGYQPYQDGSGRVDLRRYSQVRLGVTPEINAACTILITPAVTSPIRMVQAALISGVTPRRTWL